MAEHNDDQTAIERLKDKNRELLEEKRRAVAERDELAAQVEQLTAERDEAAAELRRITIDNPRRDLVEGLTVEGAADTAMREIQHFVTVEDDGTLTRDGEPVTVEGENGEAKPLRFDAEGIQALYKHGIVPSLGHMLRGKGSSGGGAAGTRIAQPPQPSQTRQKTPARQFGLR